MSTKAPGLPVGKIPEILQLRLGVFVFNRLRLAC